jgi:hypothetical protein
MLTQEDDMTSLTDLERLFERVELVRGRGDRRKGRLCIMSLVALLAGERHTDSPATASLFIRQFAITLNDAMPPLVRQRLKPFAPRIMQTNDGQDQKRLQVARDFLLQEVLPALDADVADNQWTPSRFDVDWRSYAASDAVLPQEFVLGFASQTYRNANSRSLNEMALVAAKLLVMCATSVASDAGCARYWAKSIDLLDRLCDVEAAKGSKAVPEIVIARAAQTLEQAVQTGLLARATEALRACLGAGDLLKSGATAVPPPSSPATDEARPEPSLTD